MTLLISGMKLSHWGDKITHPLERISRLIYTTTGRVQARSDLPMDTDLDEMFLIPRFSLWVLPMLVLRRISARKFPPGERYVVSRVTFVSGNTRAAWSSY